jgi:hypothetical protein
MIKTVSITILLVLILVSSHLTMAQTTVAGVTMPATMKAGNNTLVLNGAGTRIKLFMDVYVGALYLTAKSNNGDAISKSNEIMAVKIHITSGLVTSDRMTDAIKEGFHKSTGGNTTPLQTRIDKFVKVFSLEPIVKTNEFDIIYQPGTGTQIYKSGKLLETIDGLDFKTALWGIWLGAEPVEKSLKAAMLGSK